MPVNGSYRVTEVEFTIKDVKENKVEKENRVEKERVYSYEEAIDLAGTGWYTRGLLAALSVSLLSMAVDMFGISVVVTGCACHFDLDHQQKRLLMSVPFVGPIIMSYFWGYLSDTQGRRWSLLVGLWGGFIASVASAFSTHWYMLAVLKIIGTSLSSCAQSTTYTYLGESVPMRCKGPYMIVMTSALMLFILSYDVPGYFILNLDFHYDWGFIKFTPWRLLILVISAPLGASALMMHFFCESPKFLANAGQEEKALENLMTIWTKNGNNEKYPVTKLMLNEECTRRKDESILKSMYEQIVPLFKPPLLWRTLQLLYLTAVIYGINNSLVMWMPAIVEAFAAGLRAPQDSMSSSSLCEIIVNSKNTTVTDVITCTSTIDKRTFISGLAHGIIFMTITLAISRLAYRKKLLITVSFFIPLVCSLAAVFNEDNVASLVLFIGMLMTNFCMGFLFTYYVDLYPTSYRGMAACLGVMMSRLSGLAGVHFVGTFVMSHCTLTFYAFSVYLLSGILVAFFLPPDIVKKKELK